MVRRMRDIPLGSARLFAHETTMPILDPGRDKTKKGYVWAIARDDRPWGGADPSAVVFHYAPGCGAEHAKALLRGSSMHAARRSATPRRASTSRNASKPPSDERDPPSKRVLMGFAGDW